MQPNGPGAGEEAVASLPVERYTVAAWLQQLTPRYQEAGDAAPVVTQCLDVSCMHRVRSTTALCTRAVKMAAQTLLQEPGFALGSRHSAYHGSNRLQFLRSQSVCAASCRPGALCGAKARSTPFGAGRLSFSSQLLATKGERKVSSSASAVGLLRRCRKPTGCSVSCTKAVQACC